MTAPRNYSRILNIDGESKSLVQWAAIYGLSKQTLWERLDRGIDEEEAVTTPVRKYRDNKERESG